MAKESVSVVGEEMSIEAIRRTRESRMEEIRVSVAERPGAVARARYNHRSPFWNRASFRVFRRCESLS